MLPAARCARRRPAVGFAGNDHRPVVTKQIGQVAEAVGSSSHLTPRWREMDSNFRFRASGDTPQRQRGEAAFDGAEPSQRSTHTAIFCKGDVEADVLCPRACARLG
jgi:hypothetical protein